MKKTLIISLILSAAVVAFARNYIMKIDMTDGTTRYIDTEQVEEFNFTTLSEIPDRPVDKYITDELWNDAVWLHDGFFTQTARNVRITDRYVPNDPDIHEFTVYGWCPSAKPIKMTCRGNDDIRTLEIPCQPTGYTDPEQGDIWIADLEHYYTDVLRQPNTDPRPCVMHDRNGIVLEVVYYGAGMPGAPFAVQTSESIYTPGSYMLGYVHSDFATKDAGGFSWPLVFTDTKHSASRIVYKAFPYEDRSEIYNEPWYYNPSEGLDASAESADFHDHVARGTFHSDSIHSNLHIVYALYDKDNTLISQWSEQVTLRSHLADMNKKTYMGYGIYESTAFGSSYGADLTFFPADRETPDPHMELENFGMTPDYKLHISIPHGLEPDSVGYITVSVPAQLTKGYFGNDQLSIISFDKLYEMYGLDYIDQTSYYSPSDGTISLYVVYFYGSDLENIHFFGPYWENFQLYDFTRQGTNVRPKKTAADRKSIDQKDVPLLKNLTIDGAPHHLR